LSEFVIEIVPQPPVEIVPQPTIVEITQLGTQGPPGVGLIEHLAEPDPHPQYIDATELEEAIASITPASIGAELNGTAASSMAAHLAAPDPHPQYMTSAEVEALLGGSSFAPLGHQHAIADVAGLEAALGGKETVGAAGQAIAGHVAASDPHSQYVDETELSAAIASHTAATDPHPQYSSTTEVQALIADHEAESDPHPQYTTTSELSTAIANFVTNDDSRLSDNRTPIDNSVSDTKIGSRTVDQAIATPSANTGSLTQILSWLAKAIKGITGKTNWFDAPATTLEVTATHIASTSNPHSTTAAQVGADPTGTAANTMAAHLLDADPHPQYTSAAEMASAIANFPTKPASSTPDAIVRFSDIAGNLANSNATIDNLGNLATQGDLSIGKTLSINNTAGADYLANYYFNGNLRVQIGSNGAHYLNFKDATNTDQGSITINTPGGYPGFTLSNAGSTNRFDFVAAIAGGNPVTHLSYLADTTSNKHSFVIQKGAVAGDSKVGVRTRTPGAVGFHVNGGLLVTNGLTGTDPGLGNASIAGDLAVGGSINASTINATKLQGRSISTAAPTDTQALRWNGTSSQWEPQSLSLAFTYDQSATPSSPSIGQTWRERASNGSIIEDWEWNGFYWLSKPILLLTPETSTGTQFTASAAEALRIWNIPTKKADQIIYITKVGVSGRAEGATTATDYWEFTVTQRRGSGTQVAITGMPTLRINTALSAFSSFRVFSADLGIALTAGEGTSTGATRGFNLATTKFGAAPNLLQSGFWVVYCLAR
jgi:hypothetical protein